MSLFDGTPSGLSEILAAREARVARREVALSRQGLSTLTLCIVLPGAIKLCPAAIQLTEVAQAVIPRYLAAEGWRFKRVFAEDLSTGPEALFAVEADAHTLKSAMVALEEVHPLGRLWDLDVHRADGTALSRRDIGLQKRRCLICEQPAHACTRSRAHPLEDLLAEIAHRLKRHRNANILASRGEAGKPMSAADGTT